jgi:Uncharacterized protein conserved in bacteria
MNKVDALWQTFCVETGLNSDTPYQSWYFSNTPETAAELAQLVLSGKKRATASSAAMNEIEPDKAPINGGYSVVTDFDGHPICVVQTTEIRHLPFDQVDAEFAADEGEGDQSLAYWRDVHWSYFTREAVEHGFHFDENSIVCCERFELLFPK